MGEDGREMKLNELSQNAEGKNHLDEHPAALLQVCQRKQGFGHPDGMTFLRGKTQESNNGGGQEILHAMLVVFNVRRCGMQHARLHDRGSHMTNESGILHQPLRDELVEFICGIRLTLAGRHMPPSRRSPGSGYVRWW